MLTHYNVVNNGKCIGDRMDLSTADRLMIQVPMFHCFGMVLAMPKIECKIVDPATGEDLPDNVKMLSIAPLLGQAISRIHDDESVSSLFGFEKEMKV